MSNNSINVYYDKNNQQNKVIADIRLHPRCAIAPLSLCTYFHGKASYGVQYVFYAFLNLTVCVNEPQTLSSPVMQRKNMNKNIAWNVIFLWLLLQNNHNFVLANSTQATS